MKKIDPSELRRLHQLTVGFTAQERELVRCATQKDQRDEAQFVRLAAIAAAIAILELSEKT